MRLTAIMDKLMKENIIQRCHLVKFGEASEKQLLAVHSATHVKNVLSISSKEQRERDAKTRASCGELYYSEGTTKAALLAAGGVLKACEVVASGIYKYAFAVVRPPGHHASRTKPSGFCFLNNVAVGAAHLLKHHRTGKIFILDFDIHHGNGTQAIFYGDPRVLTFSVHRFGHGFYPATGTEKEIGKDAGKGFNVNVCWKHPEIWDVDYLAVWDHVLIPLIEEFVPDIILISAGFDAGKDDTLGGCNVSQSGFALLLSKLKCFERIVLALEGGYDLNALSDGVTICMKVLLGDESAVTFDSSDMLPYSSTWETILSTRKALSPYWVAVETEIRNEITSKITKYIPKSSEE
ncbi:hypothetical protein QOZ80_7AG0573790 [Eleusine coracana subsp. coracana]|nr:hypothetical protein QOZ80_7AG0573790 [Eleusine coracana subsp. coracana]